MNMQNYLLVKQKPGYIVELVGPAGAGKTTLSRTLTQHSEKFRIGADIELKKSENMPLFFRTMPLLLPIFMRRGRDGRGFSWDEMKAMVYLKGWHRVFEQQAAYPGAIVLLDHGPVFRLATLYAFGPDRLREEAVQTWWADMFARWAATLDLVIWLDAPNSVLEKRINTRQQRHAVKGKTGLEVDQFLACYRRAYEHILGRLMALKKPMLVQFDTSQSTIDQIADEVLMACNLKLRNSCS